jgi:Holliday junction DNA helicase RuvA
VGKKGQEAKMIERLIGQYSWRLPTGVILDVQGVGYGLEMAERSLQKLPQPGETIELWVHTYVREDALKLYGFISYDEKVLFGLFLSISGVGPKLAMAMMANLDASSLVRAVHDDDAKVLESVPGIGPRQSKKILLEIKPKLEKLQAAGLLMGGHYNAHTVMDPLLAAKGHELGAVGIKGFSKTLLEDLHAALTNFGYKDKEFIPVIKRLEKECFDASLPELMRLALADLSGVARAIDRQNDKNDNLDRF